MSRRFLLPIIASAALLGGCVEDPTYEYAPVDVAQTAWSPVSSPDGRDLAVVLEPRVVHRREHGVMVLGYTTKVVGPSLAVRASGEHANEPIATFERGVTRVVKGTTGAWVLQQDLDHWDHDPPNARPPSGPFTHGALLDRTSFAVLAKHSYEPPVEVPVVVGDDLFDVPQSGSSDAVREIQVRRRGDDGVAVRLHEGRGLGSAWCASTEGFALAYQMESPSTSVHLISVHFVSAHGSGDGTWQVDEATVESVRLDPTGVACSGDATHVALSVFAQPSQRSHVTVLDVPAQEVVLDALDVQGPMALRADGSAIVAMGLDRELQWVDATGAHPVGVLLDESPMSPWLSGDLALFEDTEGGLAVVRLVDGTVGTRVPPAERGGWLLDVLPWPAGGAFVAATTRSNADTYVDSLERLWLVDDQSVTDLPLPDLREEPGLVTVDQNQLLVVGHGPSGSTLFRYDLGTGALTGQLALPLCDEQTVLGGKGCR